jgi:iron complex transport system ATP-binding protein
LPVPERIRKQAMLDDHDILFELDAVSFSVGERVIVKPLTLALPQGRIYGLVGSNGSGKSTLIKVLARQQPATAGAVSLLGRKLPDFTDREFARLVAYMPQFTPPTDSLTVRELVSLGRFPWHGALGRFSEEDSAKVEEALGQTDLHSFASRMVDSLSGGERQRVWLAMMLAQDTRCLLLDEPTSALDVAHQVEILSLVRSLSRERGIGVIIVLHDINMAARYCDEIIALRDGRMVVYGTQAEILDEAILDRIYGLPMGILPHPVTGAPISYIL